MESKKPLPTFPQPRRLRNITSYRIRILRARSILLAITNVLRDKQIEFVVIRSSNSLDQVFLSAYLRRSYPFGRVVLDGSDLLFRNGMDGTSLRGVMLLTTYPLLTWEQDWAAAVASQHNGSYRVFGQDTAEALYIAVRELLRAGRKPSGVPILDYAPPAWASGSQHTSDDDRRPATWVSVIGHRQFWPLAVLNRNTVGVDQGSSLLFPEPTADDPYPTPSLLPGPMAALLVVVLLWTGWHLFCCWRGSLTSSPRALAYFAPVPKEQHQVLILLGSLLLAMLAVIIAATSGLFTWDLRPWQGILVAIFTVTIITSCFVAYWMNSRLPILYGEAPTAADPGPLWQRRGAAAFVLILTVFTLMHLTLVHCLSLANRIPAYWRSVHLLSGVSPLLPQVLLIAGMYGWFWFSLHGLALFGEDRPLLPSKNDLPPMMAMFSREGAGTPIEGVAIPLSRSYLRWLGIFSAISVAGFCLILPPFGLLSLGERLFGTMISLWLSLCIALILADSLQMLESWTRLRQLLVYLDRLTLRRTLNALKGLAWGSVWKMSGNVLEERYRVISRQFESLRHLRNTTAEWQPSDAEEIEAKNSVLTRIDACLLQGRSFAAWFVKLGEDHKVETLAELHAFQEGLASTAGLAMKLLLLPAWQKETQSLIFDRSRADRNESEDAAASRVAPSVDVAAHVRTAEEFFVLPYLGFIQNVLGRLRTIMSASLCVFVAATLAASSYPFNPLPAIGGIFLTVFTLTGAILVYVYAGMHKDATLSHIANTRPGELGGQFWVHLITFGIGPLLGLLTTLFPSITDFVVSWLQPGTQAFR